MTAAPLPNTPLADRYVLERELGAGGMATVYLARDLRHDAPVAVKVLHRELASLLSSGRFQREIQITARLQHPNILPVLDSGVADGLPFYTMPFVDGETLTHCLERDRQLPVADAVRIARQIADALGYAHARGIVHRDIKPSNVLLAGHPPKPGATSEWHAMLADFGIARAMDVTAGERITDSGIAVGTAMYMSPEQASGDKIDGRSDVYALGCVLYEMLAGQPPFTGATPQAVLARHAVDAPPSLRTIRQTVSPALEAVVARALAKVPADRFPDAAAMRDALSAAGMEQSAVLGTVPMPRRRGRPLVVAAAAVVTVAAAATAWGTLGRGAPLDENRVMVFPLVVSAGVGQPAVSGEDVATLVGNALDGVGELRWIDGWRSMNAAQRQDPDALDESAARTLARAKRCAYYVVGRVTRVGGDSVSVALDMIRTRDNEELETGSAQAPRADAWRAGLRAVNDLLPRLLADAGPTSTAEWADRPPAAVAQFLLGEAAFRRLLTAQALGHYRAAVASDPTFALAALRGAQAATWLHDTREATSLVETALGRSLPDRYRFFALGTAAYLAGRADSAVVGLRQAVALDPDMAVAWMQLGEVYAHLLPVAGDVDSLATEAFERARSIDSSAASALLHPIELAVRRGRPDVAAPLAKRFLAAKPDSAQATAVQLLMQCAQRGVAAVAWSGHVIPRPTVLLQVGREAGVEQNGACAERAFDAVLRSYPIEARDALTYRWPALIGLQSTLLARGDTATALARLDDAIASPLGGETLYLLDASVDPPVASTLASRAQAIADAEARRSGPAYERTAFPVRLWHLAVWEAHAGRPAAAEAVARDLTRRATASPDARVAFLARSAAAYAAAAAAASRADTTALVDRLTALLAEPIVGDDLAWDLAYPRAGERLLLARLLLARGEPRRAIDVANVFDSVAPLVHALYLPASLQLRLTAANALNDVGLVARYRDRLTALHGGRRIAGR